MMLKKLITTAIIISSLNVSAQTFDDIDLSGIPNEFLNGTTADADQVNANFQYLQDNLATLVSILQAQGTIVPPADRFAGTYSISGVSVLLETGNCAPSHTNGMVQVSHLSGTATSSGTSLSLSTNEPAGRLFIGTPSTNGTTTYNDVEVLSISGTGAIDTVGQFTADGSSFYASAFDDDTVSGCNEKLATYISGVRVP